MFSRRKLFSPFSPLIIVFPKFSALIEDGSKTPMYGGGGVVMSLHGLDTAMLNWNASAKVKTQGAKAIILGERPANKLSIKPSEARSECTKEVQKLQQENFERCLRVSDINLGKKTHRDLLDTTGSCR